MFTEPQELSAPAPMLLGASLPFVAVTLVTPALMVMVPQFDSLYPLPIAAAHLPPVAVTSPAEISMSPHLASLFPLPMPAPDPPP